MNRRLLLWTIGGAVVFGAGGAVIATSEPRRGEDLIAGDRPLTEDKRSGFQPCGIKWATSTACVWCSGGLLVGARGTDPERT